jgi:hypothetical protein
MRVSPDAEPVSFGISSFAMQALSSGGTPVSQAGAHPYSLTTSFALTTTGEGAPEHPVEEVKDVVLDLPMGVAVDALIAPTCPLYQLQIASEDSGCGSGSRVGTLGLELAGEADQGEATTALYDIAPEAGFPLELGALYHGHPILIYGSVVRMGSGYGVRLAIPGVTGPGVIGASLTLFGDPAQRDGDGDGDTPMLTNPLACGGPLTAKLEVDTWQHPDQYQGLETVAYPDVVGCEKLSFAPTLQVASDGASAETPSGYDLRINIPQDENPVGLATSELEHASVKLPVGISLSPPGTDGLVGCAATGPEGIDIGSEQTGPVGQDLGDPEASELGPDGLYHTAPGHCPEAATVGAVEIDTPLLAQSLQGRVFLAQPECGGECSATEAEDGELVGLYLEAAGSGVVVKLAGTMLLDQATGQLSVSFDKLPQLPIDTMTLYFDGSDRALLASPQTCGESSASSDLSPWSAIGEAQSQSSLVVSSGANGAPCPSTLPFEPTMRAGVNTPTAGSFSPLTLEISRTDGQQYLSRFAVQLPPGLEWMLSSVPLCGEPQAAQGTCPSASEIGVTQVAVGAGGDPLWLTGRVYLTGGYGGQPFGLSVAVPALAGPFNLGTVVVRAAIGLAPTGALTISVDPLPQLLDGIPLRMRTIEVAINRPEFVLNPTVCAARQITATIEGAEGASVEIAEPFVTPGCQSPPPTASRGGASTGTSTAPSTGGVEPPVTLKSVHRARKVKHKRRKKHRRDRSKRKKAKAKRDARGKRER